MKLRDKAIVDEIPEEGNGLEARGKTFLHQMGDRLVEHRIEVDLFDLGAQDVPADEFLDDQIRGFFRNLLMSPGNEALPAETEETARLARMEEHLDRDPIRQPADQGAKNRSGDEVEDEHTEKDEGLVSKLKILGGIALGGNDGRFSLVSAFPPNRVLRLRPEGLYCEAGDFFVDPWRPVARAVTTHAHSDHARPGSRSYLAAEPGRELLEIRIGRNSVIETLSYGETRRIGNATVSLHPAGHILGSAQVRIEVEGEVWVVSGDFNSTHDTGCGAPFEPVACDTFITESTFGLPIYRWPKPATVFAEIKHWWRHNRERGITTVIPAYPLGKSQRLTAALDLSIGPIAIHGNAWDFLAPYRRAGIAQPELPRLSEVDLATFKGKGLVIAFSGAQEEGLLKKLAPLSWGFASGWMMTRAARRNRDFDRGFILSDHADWPGLIDAIRATGARRIGVTHGETRSFTRWLRENGWDAFAVPTRFSGDEAAGDDAKAAEDGENV